jgi:hypothetical protein
MMVFVPSEEETQSRVPVAHSCDLSYSGDRDQEDHGSKPAQENSSRDPISKNPSQKRAGGMAHGEGPELKPQFHRREQKRDIRFEV